MLMLIAPLLLFAEEKASEEVADTDTSPYHKAGVEYAEGNYTAARAAIDAAEQAKPGDLPTEILKARIMTEQRDFSGGQKLLLAYLSDSGPIEVELALGDILLRKRDFAGATKYYTRALGRKPADPDIMLKLIYAEVGSGDFAGAGSYLSQLKPMDPDHPCYYFAKAVIDQETGQREEASQAIENARAVYGNITAAHYLKTYLQVIAPAGDASAAARAQPPATNVPAAKP